MKGPNFLYKHSRKPNVQFDVINTTFWVCMGVTLARSKQLSSLVGPENATNH